MGGEGGSLSHFPAPARARPSAHSRPLSLLAPQPRPMEPARPAPGRLGPLLCLLLAVLSAWTGKHPAPAAAVPTFQAQASQTAPGSHPATVEQQSGRGAGNQGYRCGN